MAAARDGSPPRRILRPALATRSRHTPTATNRETRAAERIPARRPHVNPGRARHSRWPAARPRFRMPAENIRPAEHAAHNPRPAGRRDRTGRGATETAAQRGPAKPEPAAEVRTPAGPAAAKHSPQGRTDRPGFPAAVAACRSHPAEAQRTDPAARRRPAPDSRDPDTQAAPADAEEERLEAGFGETPQAVASLKARAPREAESAHAPDGAGADGQTRPAGPERATPGYVAKDYCTVSSLGTPVAHPRPPDPVARSIQRRDVYVLGVPPRSTGRPAPRFSRWRHRNRRGSCHIANFATHAALAHPLLAALQLAPRETERSSIGLSNRDSNASPQALRHQAPQGLRITRAATTQRAHTGPLSKRDHPAE